MKRASGPRWVKKELRFELMSKMRWCRQIPLPEGSCPWNNLIHIHSWAHIWELAVLLLKLPNQTDSIMSKTLSRSLYIFIKACLKKIEKSNLRSWKLKHSHSHIFLFSQHSSWSVKKQLLNSNKIKTTKQLNRSCLQTFYLSVIGVCKELPYAVWGNGKWYSRRNLQSVYANYIPILETAKREHNIAMHCNEWTATLRHMRDGGQWV